MIPVEGRYETHNGKLLAIVRLSRLTDDLEVYKHEALVVTTVGS